MKFPIYYGNLWNIKFMFQATNHFFYVYQRVRPLSAQIGDGDVGFTTLNVILRMNMYKLSIVSGLLDVLASFTS
jgi:hypothetical protein